MIPEFTASPYYQTHQSLNVIETTIDYLRRKAPRGVMLDIGRRSPLTYRIEAALKIKCVNTHGDLDLIFDCDEKRQFASILYSHTIEHQFNPLNTLMELKRYMSSGQPLFILLPSRTKMLWCRNHFHEIDHYRMQLLLQRAGMQITSYERHKVWRQWWYYLTGVRPFLRLFLEFNAYYEVRLK